MELAHALRYWKPDYFPACLAIAGAGGKTTAMFNLARQLVERSQAPVLVTTTTHLATNQLGFADRLFILEEPADVDSLENQLSPQVILVVGVGANANRISGPDTRSLERLHELADTRQIPLLIEADGSRQRPAKAPEEHEPAIPVFADSVLVVAGLTALGKPLTSAWVHRPERFAELTGLEPGETITVRALERLLLDSNGGLKGIPANARCMALLNGADTPDIRAQANELAQSLLHAYRSVLVAALGTAGTVFSAYEPAAGVVLAAGAARRFGQQKQLLLWRGQPLVRHAVLAALRGGLSPVVVVTGAYAEGVEAVLRDLPVVFANNPDWAQGQSTSLQAGLRRLSPEIGSAVILLADQPLIPDKLVRTLVETHASTLSPLVAPRVNGQRVNPVLFDSLTFPDLFALTGDTGGRPLFSEPYRYPVAWVDWMEESLFMDVDTEQDYRGLIERENGNATREI